MGFDALSAISQPLRFGASGALTAVTYLGGTLLLSGPLGISLQIAILVAYALSLCLHFTLQRYVVFRDHDRFELELHRQAGRYLAVAGAQYAFTATVIAVVPGLLHVDERVVYVVTALFAATVSFVLLRTRVFHGS
jgi:putative flippase GtrA